MKKHLAKKGLAYMLMASMAISSMSVVAYAEDGSEQTAAVVSTGGEISTLGTEDSAEGQEGNEAVPRSNYVAKIGDKSYETLEEAFSVVKDQETIELLADVTLDKTEQVYPNSALMLSEKEQVTIDGQGHTITTTYIKVDSEKNRGAHVLGIEGCSGITVVDLKINGDGKEYNGINVYKSKGVTLKDVTVTGVNGGGIMVNASQVTALGTIEMENNGWGNAINVGWGSNIEGADACSFDGSKAEFIGVSSVYTNTSDSQNANGKKISISMPSGYIKTTTDSITQAYVMAAAEVETANGEKTYYASLQDAVNNAKNGAVITIQKDLELTEQVKFIQDVILDLGGHVLHIKSHSASSKVALYFDGSDSLVTATVKNGVIMDETGLETSGNYTVYGIGKVNLTTEDIKIGCYASKNTDNYNYLLRMNPSSDETKTYGTLTVGKGTLLTDEKKGDYESYGAVGIAILGIYDNGNNVPEDFVGPKVVIKEGAEVNTTGFALCGNGASHGTTFVVEGGELIARESTAIYHPQKGNLTISGGYISGGEVGIEIRAGELTVSGGKIEGLATPTATEPNGNGTTASGAGIAVNQHTTKLPINVNITGGTIEGYSALYEKNVQNNPDEDIKKVQISVSGGYLNATNSGIVPVYSEDKVVDITGGTFSHSAYEYVDNSWYELLSDGMYSYYSTAEAAKAAAKAGAYYIPVSQLENARKATVKIVNDSVEESYNVAVGGNMLLPAAPVKSGYTFRGWAAADGTLLAAGAEVAVKGDAAYTASWKKKSSSSSSDSSTGGSGSGTTGTTTETTENKDGSTTTTVTKPDGTKTETTENKDGSTVTVVTKPDGTKTETTENKDGSKVEVTETKDGTVTTTETDKDGNKTETVETKDGAVTTTVERVDGTTSKVTVDADGVTKTEVSVSKEAAEENEVVELPIPSVRAEKDASDAAAVEIEVKGDEATKVEIPVKNMTAGTVAVMVDEFGGETVIKTSLAGENGVVVNVEGTVTVKIVDNSKDFADVADTYWGSDAVQFAASRELFAGTAADTFSPDASMTRAMVWTVLARLDGVATGGGVNWYAAGQAWAMENGISDGSDLNGQVSREQLAAMLYRYAQLKGYDTSAQADLSKYADVNGISAYAVEAMQWANAAGVVNGTTTTTLDAGKDSTRAQVATMLMNFCKNVVE